MNAPTTHVAAALARLLHRGAVSLQSRGEFADALILHERVIALSAELLGQGANDLWPTFAASASDRVRALTALGRHADGRAAERDALAALTPDAPAQACETIAELLLERADEPREGEGLRLAAALVGRLPARSPLREALSDRLG
jgi:hypothetical protein